MQYEIASGRFNPQEDHVELRGVEFGWTPGVGMIPDIENPTHYRHTFIHQVERAGENIPDYKFWYQSELYGESWESGENKTYILSEDDFNSGQITLLRSFDDINLENSTNRKTAILIQVDTKNGKDVNGNSLPDVINSLHITGSAVPLTWKGWMTNNPLDMIQMFDDGSNGDMVPGDKIYSRLITFNIYSKFRVEYSYVINFNPDLPKNIVYENNGGDNHVCKLEHDLVKAKVKNVYGFMSNYGEIITPLYDKEYTASVENNSALSQFNILIASTSGKIQKDIIKAFEFFNRSIAQENYIDENHLKSSSQLAFEESKNAVQTLMKLEKESIYLSSILPMILNIYKADKYIVEYLYDELMSKFEIFGCTSTLTANCIKWKRELDDALSIIIKANKEYSNQNYDKAIINLKQAWLNLIKVQGMGLAKEVGEEIAVDEIPTEFSLSQNYPNPFNPSTKIQFGLPSDSKVQINIYNILGQKVHTLADQFYSAGIHTLNFNADELSNGVYIYSISAISNEGKIFRDTKKMLLVK